MQSFPNAKKATLDNEPGFTTAPFKSLLLRLNIELCCCTTRYSKTKAERIRSILTEIAKCLKEVFYLIDDAETFYRAAQQYNQTIHSVIQKTPFDFLITKTHMI